jgi:PAS domain S-box-containing protein
MGKKATGNRPTHRDKRQVKESSTRRQMEVALRETKERCSALMESLEDAYFEVDTAGNLTFFNDALCIILGYSPDELMGMNNRQYMTSETAETVYHTFHQVYLTGKPAKAFDFKLLPKAGEAKFVDASVSLIRDAKGAPVGFRGIARDITEQKKLMREQELLSDVKERLIGHLAHELITPIALVEVSLDLLWNREIPESEKENALQRIRRNLDRLKDIQRIAREVVTSYEHQPQRLQVDTAIGENLDNLRMRSAHRYVTIEERLESIDTDIIDPTILKKVLTALVKNAIENTPDEGAVTVALTRVPRGVCVTVEDHGIGIAASDVPLITRGFYPTQEPQYYSTKRPFDFNAGGKGLELMRLKLLEMEGAFTLSFDSSRCTYLEASGGRCPGKISSCPHVKSQKACLESGGTRCTALFFRKTPETKAYGQV